MSQNLDLFEKDPRTHTLLNQGVAKVTSGQSTAELDTLRYELDNFVCDGQYADGLGRILTTYLGHLDKPEQPGVWVSGFFGSGKSHLVKMLQHLWTDFEFPDKAKARGVAKLPSEVTDHLKELTNAAKRAGGLHAAGGTLGAGAGDSIRLEVLGIVFKSVGLPEQYARAGFMLWLREEGLEAGVRDFVKQAGGDFDRELANLYVSDLIARAILDTRPDFAAKPADVRLLLQKQFPKVTDISIEDMIEKIKQAIGSRKGKLPCTLVVLDEVQQFIGDDASRSKAVQDVQEQCCSRLGANFLLVATGQNALSGTPLLQKLQGRFPVTVELQDTDVEQVTREVVLKKKPSAEPGLKALLDAHSGEIERQLSATKIAFTSRDRGLLVKDYPILPVRRRFWEKVLRAVDTTMTGAQLRSQLRIVHDAVRETAHEPLGTVVSGAFLYPHILSRVLQSGVLLQEISETIARQRQEQDGDLRYQLCALIFLVGQLPRQGPADAGVRADADTLADLLVTDLTKSSGELRKKVPDLLEKLVAAGAVMKVEDEYRMQTREGSEWNQAYIEAKNKLLADAGKLGSERSQLLRSQCGEFLKKFKLVQGVSKEPRKIDLRFGDTAPDAGGDAIPVWVRDGWDVEEKAVQNDARAAGDTAAVVYGFVPKKDKDTELRQVIASYYAATTTLQAKGTPSTDEGREAHKSMETRRDQAHRDRDRLVTEILNDTSVYVAGGDQMGGTLLGQKVEDAARACLDRLYPQFHLADSPDWHKVIERSKKGDGDALAVVGHKGDPESHPVCKAVVDYVGSGRKGTDVRKQFGGGKYGWPQDAIDAVLIVLFQSGAVQAKIGTEPVAKGKLDQKAIAAAEFRVENITLSKTELIALRGLFKKIGLNTQPGQESVHAAEFLNLLRKLAEAAGGDVPLPKQPDTAHLADIANRVGNDQLKALHDQKDRLAQEVAEWQKRRDMIAQRHPRWRQLRSLLDFAADLPVAAGVQAEVAAIEQHRGLLADPDPVPSLSDKLTDALRAALNAACTDLHAAMDAGEKVLEALPEWEKITPDERFALRNKNRIRLLPEIAVGTADEILQTLGRTKLSQLRDITDALPGRFTATSTDLAKMREPKAQSVSLPGATIKTEADLQAWFEEVEGRVLPKLKDGPVIL